MSGFWSLFNSVSSTNSTATTTTSERSRVIKLREPHTAHPLIQWDTNHVISWLQTIGPIGFKYLNIARSNLLTGSTMIRIHRTQLWNDPEYGLGITNQEDLKTISDAFDKRKRQVIVRVYDVTGGLGPKGKTALLMVNKIFRSSLGGAYHCGVEIYGLEWAFGDGGVYCTRPKREIMGHHFREVVHMPRNDDPLAASDRCLMTQKEVRSICENLKPMWPGSRYDLVHCNCCHFADELCKTLGMGSIPTWINRAARIGAGADVSWLSGNQPHVPKELKGSKEDEQAQAMYDSATKLFSDGLITREEYRNLREKHKRYVDEISGKGEPVPRARIQSTSVAALSDANKEAKSLLDSGVITQDEYHMITSNHGNASGSLGHGEEKDDVTLTKQQKMLGIGAPKTSSIDSSNERRRSTVIELEL